MNDTTADFLCSRQLFGILSRSAICLFFCPRIARVSRRIITVFCTEAEKIYKKILHSDEGGLKILVKVVCFRRNFMAHFKELPEDQGGITCMKMQSLIQS